MIVNDYSSVIRYWSFKLIDDPRVIIYGHHRFIIQATAELTLALGLLQEINKVVHELSMILNATGVTIFSNDIQPSFQLIVFVILLLY
jgi:hypothetical protein